MSGSMRSRTIASGASARASAIPSRPLPAEMTRTPSNSRASRKPRTMLGSSSTTRTVLLEGGIDEEPIYTATVLRRRRERRANGFHVPRRHPGHREQRRVVGRADGRQVSHMPQKRLLGGGPEALDVVERRP